MLAEDVDRLQKIDKLYALRLDKQLSLPMLILVGDQSSGKSSVLDGLSGLPLPRDSALCTRFPTHIVFKRYKEKRISLSIIAASTPDPAKQKLLEAFARDNACKDIASFDAAAFRNLLFQAATCMGIIAKENEEPKPTEKSHLSAFSSDVLKIDLCGPEYEHFSIVDLPGLFRTPTPGETTKSDIDVVRTMVAGYLKNERSVILAVVPANVDIATQEIVQMAEDVDPKRRRTLGVLTKPDLVDEGAEDKVIELAGVNAGQSLGYTVVCNRSQGKLQSSTEERDANEREFFKGPPWDQVSSKRAGIGALKNRLNDLLVKTTREHFSMMALDLNKKLNITEEKLKKLGRARCSSGEQRAFLLQIAADSQALITKAIDSYYRDACFTQYPELKIATFVAQLNQLFADRIRENGSTWKFASLEKTSENAQVSTPLRLELKAAAKNTQSLKNDTDEDSESSVSPCKKIVDTLKQMETSLAPELAGIFSQVDIDPSSKLGIMDWISDEYRESRGFEIATVNPSVLPSLFGQQSKKWGPIAISHVQHTINFLHKALHTMLEHVCPNGGVFEKIWPKIRERLLKTYERALEHTRLLVEVEAEGHPLTLNHYFAENFKKAQMTRIKNRLRRSANCWDSDDDDPNMSLLFKDVLDAYASNDDQQCESLHDALHSYYKVARKRFVDSVCKQAVDHFLICSKDGPLRVFSPEFVGSLTDQEVEALAGEDAKTIEIRHGLEAEIERLREGKKVLET